MSNRSACQIIALSHAEHDGFTALLTAVRLHSPQISIEHVQSVSEVESLAGQAEWIADLLLVWQQWPDEYASEDVRRLLAVTPLSRLVCCYGPWCIADGRTREIWPPSVRVPWEQAGLRIANELSVRRGDLAPLPLTAGRDEIFAFGIGRSETGPGQSLPRTAVVSPDAAYRHLLVDWLGDSCGKLPRDGATEAPDAILWDADPWNGGSARQLRMLREELPSTAVVALTSHAYHDAAAIRSCGAHEVVPKLATLVELGCRL